MKLSILFGVLLFVACQQNDYTVRPDARMEGDLVTCRERLTSSPHGWKGILQPAAGGGFGFYLRFDSDGRVQMLADLDNESGQEIQNSSYQLVAALRPSLYFDSYSYLHYLADPSPEVAGGAVGSGYQSDFEFWFEHVTEDTIRLRGNVHQSSFMLVRASQQEAIEYENGGLASAKKSVTQLVDENQFLFLDTPEGAKALLTISLKTRQLSLTKMTQGVVHRTSTPFAFSSRGLVLAQTLYWGDESINEVLFDSFTRKLFVRIGNSRKDVKISATPILPLHEIIGFEKKAIVIPPGSENDIWSLSFNSQWRGLATAFYSCCGLIMDDMELEFDRESDKLFINMYIYSPAQDAHYLLQYPYACSIDSNGVFKLQQPETPNTLGGYLSMLTLPMRDQFEGYSFTLRYTSTEYGYRAHVQNLDMDHFHFTGDTR